MVIYQLSAGARCAKEPFCKSGIHLNSTQSQSQDRITKYGSLIVCLFLIISTLVAYVQILQHDFVYFDDHRYAFQNSDVMAGLTAESIRWAFTTTFAQFWHPLTWLSLMLDTQVFGVNPGGYLFTNLLLHICSTLLLFFILKRATGAIWQSGFVAALFALHPMHVESVAWIAQRKDVLSTFFWMLTLWCYIIYTQRPGAKIYLAVVLFLIMGLMAKPMLVTLPFVLLLFDFWPLGRLPATSSVKSAFLATLSLIREKIPLFLIVAAASIVAYLAQQGEGRIKSFAVLPMEERLFNVLVSYAAYIGKMMWPQNLACFYPMPDGYPLWQVGLCLFVLMLISGITIRCVRQYPFLSVGWLWYLGTLIPVIGFVKIGAFAFADRYTYVPLIGLFIMLAWGVPELLGRWDWKFRTTASAALAALALAVCLVTSWFQVRVWQNRATLWSHALQVTSDNYFAHNERGIVYRLQGRFDEATRHFFEALRIQPRYIPTYINLGNTFEDQEKTDEAITYYAEAARRQPMAPEPHLRLGILYRQRGELAKTVTHLRSFLEINPEDAFAHKYLAGTLLKLGKPDEAIRHYSESLRLQPANAEVHYNLAIALENQGKTAEAIENYSAALDLNPENADAHYNLANVMAKQQRFNEAIAHYQKSLAIKPDQIQPMNNLAFVYAEMQKYEEAILILRQLVELQPDNPQNYYLVASLYAKQNRIDESIKWLETAFSKGYINCDVINTDSDLEKVKISADYDDLMRRYCH